MNTKNLFTTEKQQEIAANFERVMNYTYLFFGNQNFRITGPNRSRSIMNGAVLESVGSFFAKQTNAYLDANRTVIQENFKKLIQNIDYINAVSFRTEDPQQVHQRITLATAILSKNTTI
jgi:coproporphyrinogen III oxidase